MNKSKVTALVAAVCALGFGVADIAAAQTAGAPAPQLVIHYNPSSLTTESGVRNLYGRLISAAEKVCDAPQVGRFPSEAVVACRKQAVAGAVAQIHNARLADLSARYAKIG
jgi:UrcA family protein